jgi:hypothetical protein
MSEAATERDLKEAAGVLQRTGSWNLSRVVVGLAILFSGILIGVGATIVFGRDVLLNMILTPPDPARIADYLTHDLNLTPEQEAEFEEIFKKHLEALDEIRESVDPLMKQQIEILKSRVSGILNKDQAQRWEDRIGEFQRIIERGHKHLENGESGTSKSIDKYGDDLILQERELGQMSPTSGGVAVRRDKVTSAAHSQSAQASQP